MSRSQKPGAILLLLSSIFCLLSSPPGYGFQPSESHLRREGAFWVQTVTGSEAASPAGRLKASTRGGITVRGQAIDRIEYSLTKRVKARNEAEARRMLSRFLVTSSRRGDVTVLSVAYSDEGHGSADLAVTVPRSLRYINIDTHGGAVEASELDGSLEAETGGGAMRLNRIGGNVSAKTAGGEIKLGTISGSVRATSAGGPINAELIQGDAVLETAGGEIVAREVGGKLRAATAGGSIRVVRARGPVSANTAGGSIDIGAATGSVTAQSSGGSIDVGGATGVRCETAGGAIRLNQISGSLRATTAVGSIIARLLSGGTFGDSFLTTANGDITVFIPSNVKVTIRAQNESPQGVRRIVSDFPEVVVRTQGSLTVAEGMLNGGGPLLRIAGNGGTIYIRRQQ